MNILTGVGLLIHILKWRLTWSRHDLDLRMPGLDPRKFGSARDAAARIPDGAVCMSSGMAGNARCSIFYWAIRDRFLGGGHPRDLTWISVGAHGSRGRVPGTVEELALPGLITRYVAGHAETKKAILKLVAKGMMELHTMPQGQMAFCLEAQARGEDSVVGQAGVGTFLDPRVGTGSIVAGSAREGLIDAVDGGLRYRLPRVMVSLANVPYADDEGNLYMHHASTLTETVECARAARANGGIAMATVSGIIPKDPSRITLRADEVDLIVVNPWSEQTGSVPQSRYWKHLTPESDLPVLEAVQRLRFICDVMRITPKRTPVDKALARLAAVAYTRMSRRGAMVNIGVGLPEEVCRVVFEAGLARDLTFMTETGVIGGLPAPGIFFGAAANPERLVTSAEGFHLCYRQLDTTILGVLEADEEGNVNVSKRGDGALNYVGPGGLPDMTTAARNVLFVGSWMSGGCIEVRNGQVRILKPGRPKFVRRVDEVTFSGREALAAGKDVLFATNVGVFRLTERGMVLVEVMPGIDVRRDVLDVSPMKIVIPEGGPAVADRAVVTGEGFRLAWP